VNPIIYSGIPDKIIYCDICERYITGDARISLFRIIPIEVRSIMRHNYAFGAKFGEAFLISKLPGV